MKDSFKNIMSKVEIKKAPEGFAERLLLRIEEESATESPVLSSELLSKKQKIMVTLLISVCFLAIFIFLSKTNNTESPVSSNETSWNLITTIKNYLQNLSLFSHFPIIASGISFILICFLILDMSIRKGLKLSF